MKYEQSFRFSKEERISGETRIETLFKQGRSFVAYPLRVVYLETESVNTKPVAVLISIPKKRIKSAVKRNRMKRVIREAYRQNKHLLSIKSKQDKYLIDIAFVYLKDEVVDYVAIEKGIQKALKELSNRIGR